MPSQNLASLVERLTLFGVRLFRDVASSAKTSAPNRLKTNNFAAKSLQIFELSKAEHAMVNSYSAFIEAQRSRHLFK